MQMEAFSLSSVPPITPVSVPVAASPLPGRKRTFYLDQCNYGYVYHVVRTPKL